MRPVVRTRTLPAGVVGAICASQTPGGAGNLIINGSLASGGVVNLGSGTQRQVGITSAGNDSGVNFTITGTDANGQVVSETLAGPNANTVNSVNSYQTITQISVNGAAAAALTVDTLQQGADQPVPVDTYLNPGNVNVSVTLTGSVNYTVQYTLDDVQSMLPTQLNWFSAPAALVGASSNQAASISTPIRALRLVTNSGAGTAKMTVVQSGAIS